MEVDTGHIDQSTLLDYDLLIDSDDSDEQLVIEDSILPGQQIVTINNQKITIDKDECSNVELIQKVYKQLQLIYIISYCQYKRVLQKMASQYKCQIFLIKNMYVIYSSDMANVSNFSKCKQQIHQYISQIVYTKIQDHSKRYKILNSPHIHKIANQRFINICAFNREVYIYTNGMTDKQLDEEKRALLYKCNVFQVGFMKRRNIDLIDLQVVSFYKQVLGDYYQPKWAKLEVVVEVTFNNKLIYIHGKSSDSQHQMMEAKYAVKQLIEGLTGVAIKNPTLSKKQQSKLHQYVSEVSKFPITCGKLSQSVIILLSKDQIMRELLKKSQFCKMVGVTKNSLIGLFIPCCYSGSTKRQQIHKICKQQQYQYWGVYGVKYFRPLISPSQGEIVNMNDVLNLIVRIIFSFIQVKEKFQMLSTVARKKKEIENTQKKKLQKQNKFTYQLKNNKKDSKQLQKMLRRDVQQDDLFMKQRYTKIYSIMVGKQSKSYYMVRKNYDRGIQKQQVILLQKQQLDKGQFLQVKFKYSSPVSQNSKQQLTAMFNKQLLRLSQYKPIQGAIDDKLKRTDLNNKEREIAHMLVRLITIY